MQCPVISSVNDEEAQNAGIEFEKASPCPLEENVSEMPSMQEYRKLKKTIALMIQFYRNGSAMKGNNYRSTVEEIEGLENDQRMALEQLGALEQFKEHEKHGKYREVRELCESDVKRFEEQLVALRKKAEKQKGLMEWSWEIVKICEWLEKNLDHHCSKHLELPQETKDAMQPVPQLSPQQISQYCRGLDEITHNLNESRDFFQAAVDGRMDQYYGVEKQMYEEQLKVLQEFPKDNPRRELVEDQLNEELKHAVSQMEAGVDESQQKRRAGLLTMHLDFLRVLLFFRKIKVLDDGIAREDRQYNSEYTTTFG